MFSLKTYLFEHPSENEVRTITRRSYIYAALFGSLYVLAHGFVGRFFVAFTVDIACAAVGLLLVSVAAIFLHGIEVRLALVAIFFAILAARARPIISIVKVGYQMRGWATMPT